MAKKAKKKKKKGKQVRKVANNAIINKPKKIAERTKFNIGDFVVVKEGVPDPDFDNEIGGWQGRIYKIDDNIADEPLISIEWDSITLKNMPSSVIETSEKDTLDCFTMDLYSSELEPAKSRDKEEDVEEAIEMISEKYNLEDFEVFDDDDEGEGYDDEGDDEIDMDKAIERIQAILGVADEEAMGIDDENLEKYFQYLKKNVKFPCIVTGADDFPWEEFYVFGPGDEDEYEEFKKTQPSFTDEFSILSFDDDYDEDSGILVNVRRISDKKEFTLPLEDLEAVDKNSNNYQILDDYSTWFVNFG